MYRCVAAPSELAEDLSDLLMEICSGGYVEGSDLFDDIATSEEFLCTCYFESCAGVELLQTRCLDEFGESVRIDVSEMQDVTWKDAWKEHWRPQKIGQSLWVCPSWESVSAGVDEHVLYIEPKMAFGTGGHETTQLVLERLELLCTRTAPPEILDVGCGTGVLALAARRFGVRRAVGIDISPEAVAAAIESAERNAIDNVFFSDETLSSDNLAGQQFQLVVANILSSVLKELWSDLCARIAPGGILVISGVLESEEQEFYAAVGATPVWRARLGEWIAAEFRF